MSNLYIFDTIRFRRCELLKNHIVTTIPKHIAFIMDGNATWAKRNSVLPMDGYLTGMQTMATIITVLAKIKIRYGTFYAFSSENWQRPESWVDSFMSLAMNFFKTDEAVQRVIDCGARIKVIGDISRLPSNFRKILAEYEQKTRNNKVIDICLAISYGGRDEIVRAAKRILESGCDFSEDAISNHLDTAGIPDPDLIIRTSGKKRLSNFLLWQASYSELYFSKLLWPDFDEAELQKAIADFSSREKTYGK